MEANSTKESSIEGICTRGGPKTAEDVVSEVLAWIAGRGGEQQEEEEPGSSQLPDCGTTA